MKVDSAAVSGTVTPKLATSADEITRVREETANRVDSDTARKKVQPEEILDQIKSLTEDGAYSVRFEMEHKTNQMVVRLVEVESGEMIRQIPPEELIDLTKHLKELRGSLVDTTG
ncbi:MAG: flagellar protein FlaG [Syntrophotaleaceae bacterium]